jgi:ankyrin repeat protein
MSLKFETFCDHAAHGRLAIVKRMLESGKLRRRRNGNLNDAIERAAANGHVVDYLLRHAMFDPSADDNRNRNRNRAIAIQLAAKNGHLAVVERLLQDERVDPSASNNLAIRMAAQNGHLTVVERLLQDPRVDPSANAIQFAAVRGHVAVVERLLDDDRVDPSANNNNAVRWAAHFGHLAVVDRLLEDDRVDFTVAIQHSRPEHRKRFEYREHLTEICIALQDLALPAWVTVQILDAARPWSTLPLHSKWSLVCAVKHFHDKHHEP